MKSNFPIQFLAFVLLIVTSCKEKEHENSCSRRFYYVNGEKFFMNEIPYKATILFNSRIGYDSIAALLKNFKAISYYKADDSIETKTLIVTVDSKNCRNTDDILTEIKKFDAISDATKWLTNGDLELGLSNEFNCKLKNDSLQEELKRLIEETKTFLISSSYGTLFIKADKNSKGDAMDMANYFFEKGYFIWSQPSMIGGEHPVLFQ